MKKLLAGLLSLGLVLTYPSVSLATQTQVEQDEVVERVVEHELAPLNKDAYAELLVKKGL